MIDPKKCEKLIQCLQRFTSDLTANKAYHVHSHIDQFFYMQRVEELRLLLEQFEEAKSKLELSTSRMQEAYTSTYHQWKQDVRWYNAYLHVRDNLTSKF